MKNLLQKLSTTNRSLLMTVLILATTAPLTGCIQSQSVAATLFSDAPPVSKHAVRLVNESFHSTFIGGDWYYQGTQVGKGNISAFIQIPQKLNMNETAQKRYLQQAICPSANKKELWQQLNNVSLTVHIYTMHKKFSVNTECPNPLQARQA